MEAQDLQVESLFSTSAGASAHATHLIDIYSGTYKLLRIVVGHKAFLVDIGHVVRVNSAKLLMDRKFVVLAISTDAQSLEVELILFG